MKFRKDFIGLDGFHWWFGVVENRIDPLQLGRCQVRIFGVHSASLSDIPSADLPWALPVHSLNNQTFSTPKEGDYVFGFFIDGTYSQQPVMVGIVPGIPQAQTDPNAGFADLRTAEEIAGAPKKPNAVNLPTDGTGAEIEEIEDEDTLNALRNPSVFQIGYPTNSNLTRNENIDQTIVQLKEDNVVEVPTTSGATWKEPAPAYDAEYPYNKVLETESGHVMEFDDTPGSERVSLSHRSGTFEEVYPTGTKVEKIVKNKYQVVLKDDHLYVSGKVKVTIGSDADIVVLGNVNLEAYNDLNATVAGSVNYTVGEDFNVKAANINLEAGENISELASGAVLISSSGDSDESGVFISSEDGSVGISAGDVSATSGSGITLTALTDVSTTATGFITQQAGGAISLQSGGTFGLSTGGLMSISAGGAAAIQAGAAIGLVAGGAIAGAAAGGIGWTAGGVFSAIAGLKASIFSGLGTDIDMLPIPVPPVASPPIIIPGIPGGEVPPAYETGLGDAPERAEYNDEPPFFEREKRVRIPQEQIEEIVADVTEYIKDPKNFYNSDAEAAEVKPNYPGTPDTTGVGESILNQNNPDTTDGSDLKSWLSDQLDKTNANGFWLETGMGGNPSNQNITNIWKDLGFGSKNPWNSDQTAWCMGFVNYALKQNGYRFVQTAAAFDIRNRLSDYGATQVNAAEARSGDIALWNFKGKGHVNFVYNNDGGAISFVGGNQKPKSNFAQNNPSQGDVTLSNPNITNLIGIYRPVKV